MITKISDWQHQKTKALRVFDIVREFEPNSIIAGGSVCDWDHGILARDVDIYTHTSDVAGMIAHVSKALGVTPVDLFDISNKEVKQKDEDYEKESYVKDVYEFSHEGQDYQIVFTITANHSVDVINKFSHNMAQIWIDWNENSHEYETHSTRAYGFGFGNKILLYYGDVTKQENYYIKTMTKFQKRNYIITQVVWNPNE
jgi:hypothetical protein